MLKKMLSLLMALLLVLSCASGEDWMTGADQEDAVDVMNESVIYDAADSVGDVVNGSKPNATMQQKIVYSFTPVEVVIVLDTSGSMDVVNPSTGKTLLGYATEAAQVFGRTLLSVNPASRIGAVRFDSSAGSISGMRGFSDQQELFRALAAHTYGGGYSTNTGAGFQAGAAMLDSSAMQGRRRMVLMITDGLANDGVGDPIQYAISQGQAAASGGTNVYTIGLVGGMTAAEKRYTRRVLSAGYQTRYFEVDFTTVGDMGTALANIMTTLPVAVSSAETMADDGSLVETSTYRLSVGPGYETTVSSGDECLSSVPDQYNEQSSFGSMSVVDGSQTFVMLEGDYDIDIQGVSSGKGGYAMSEIAGLSMEEDSLLDKATWGHPSVHMEMQLKGGKLTVNDLSYNPIDVTAADEAGNPVTGLSELGGAYVMGIINVYAAPQQGSEVVAKVPKNGRVKVIAHDTKAGYSFVIVTDDKGLVRRGWMKSTALKEQQGFVPEMAWLSGAYTVLADGKTWHAPDIRAAEAYPVKAGAQVELKLVDRDENGREWAYVCLTGKKKPARNAWIPADQLEGWQTMTAETFRIGKEDPIIDPVIAFPPMLDVIAAQKLNVYSGPDTTYWRGAKGKAMVNTNGGLYAAGWVDNDWLLVQYGTTVGNRRTGYVYAAHLKDNFSLLPQLNFASTPATITTECILTDDPENYSDQIVTLAPGTQVTFLAEYSGYNGGQPFHYIETKVGSKKVRGFVPVGCLEK